MKAVLLFPKLGQVCCVSGKCSGKPAALQQFFAAEKTCCTALQQIFAAEKSAALRCSHSFQRKKLPRLRSATEFKYRKQLDCRK